MIQLSPLFFSLELQPLCGMDVALHLCFFCYLLISIFFGLGRRKDRLAKKGVYLFFSFILNEFYGKFYCLSDMCRGSYWLFTYGGYEGDLTPKSTLELLRGKDDVVLVDVRPEARGSKFF